jgi:hypothetical protein
MIDEPVVFVGFRRVSGELAIGRRIGLWSLGGRPAPYCEVLAGVIRGARPLPCSPSPTAPRPSAKASYPLPMGEGATQRLVVSLQRFVILYHAKTQRHEEEGYRAQPLFSAVF